MKLSYLPFVWILVFFFWFAQLAHAGDVVINEFLVDPDSSQWVELYNRGSTSVNISGWFIDDSGGTEKFTIPSDTIIDPGSFRVFESHAFNLNRTTADTVRLLNGSTEEDSYSYTSGPGSGLTFGRNTDGTSNWVTFSSSSKGSSNNSSSPLPSVTPTPTITSTSTPSPKPSATPKPTPTQKPSSTPKAAPTEKSTSMPLSTSTPAVLAVAKSSKNISPKPTPIKSGPTEKRATNTQDVLGMGSKQNSLLSPTPTVEQQVLGVTQNNVAMLFITAGSLLLIVCGILAYKFYSKNHIVSYE